MSDQVLVVGMGRMAYAEALETQRRLAMARITGAIESDLLLLVEHPPVVTLGRGTEPAHLLTPPDALAAKGIGLFEIERGGDVTYHGPGQLVGYPIYDLTEHKKDLHWFLRRIEAGIVEALAMLSVTGETRDGLTGVWIGGRKIASIGIHVKRWVTWHGFALNVTTHLPHFDLIVPCGIDGVIMTSVAHELGERAPRDLWGRALDATLLGFAEAFHQRPQPVTLQHVMARAAEPATT